MLVHQPQTRHGPEGFSLKPHIVLNPGNTPKGGVGSCRSEVNTFSVLAGFKKIWGFKEKPSGPWRVCGWCIK
jgi:hypothetical protein